MSDAKHVNIGEEDLSILVKPWRLIMEYINITKRTIETNNVMVIQLLSQQSLWWIAWS